MRTIDKQHCPSAVLKAKMLFGDGENEYFFPRLYMETKSKCRVMAPDDVIIEPIYTGVCGTDISILKHEKNGTPSFKGPTKLPVIIGHEFSGIVCETGRDSRFKPGNYVVAESIEACGFCDQCLLGHLNQCLNIELIGLTKDGAFSNSICVKDRHVYSIQKLVERFGLNKALQIGSLLEPAGCAYNGLMIDPDGNTVSKIKAGSHVAVFGCGPIGLLSIALAKSKGAKSIVAFDRLQSKVDLAIKMGASAAFVVDENLQDNYLAHTNGKKANILVEASGSSAAIEAAFSIIAPRGILLIKGRLPDTSISIDPNVVVSNAVSIIGVRGHAGYSIYKELINWFYDDPIDIEALIHEKIYSFADVLNAIDVAKSHAGKVLCINPKYAETLGVPGVKSEVLASLD